MKTVTVQSLNGGKVKVLLSDEDEAEDLGPFMESGGMLMRMHCLRPHSRMRIGLYRRNGEGVFVYQGLLDIGLKDGHGNIEVALSGDLIHCGDIKDMPANPSDRGSQFFSVQDIGPAKAIQAYVSFGRREPAILRDEYADDDRVDDDPARRTHNDQ